MKLEFIINEYGNIDFIDSFRRFFNEYENYLMKHLDNGKIDDNVYACYKNTKIINNITPYNDNFFIVKNDFNLDDPIFASFIKFNEGKYQIDELFINEVNYYLYYNIMHQLRCKCSDIKKDGNFTIISTIIKSIYYDCDKKEMCCQFYPTGISTEWGK